jgi:hypothetical protein
MASNGLKWENPGVGNKPQDFFPASGNDLRRMKIGKNRSRAG